MENLRNSQRSGTVSIQQFIQINRSLPSKGSPICERHFGALPRPQLKKNINAHMDALVNLPTVENARNLQAVGRLYNEVQANVRTLSAQGRNAEEYGELYFP